MRIHQQGFKIIIISGLVFAMLITIAFILIHPFFIRIPLIIVLSGMYFLIWWFFRLPERIFQKDNRLVYAPADGKIVVIEKTFENEYFNDERIQISIFMSPLNMHANYYPVSGRIAYMKYHPGKYLVAWHPKSSAENERSTLVVEDNESKIMIRQIAGILARRIITNATLNDVVNQGEELGFIRFGSRVDVFLPKSARITARLNQTSRAMITVLAELR